MRQATGSTWTFGLVLTFILIFAAFLLLTLDYSSVFKVHAETINILEKYEGLTNTSKEIIDQYLLNNNYEIIRNCPDDYYAVVINENNVVEGGQGHYCIKKTELGNDKMYFDLIVFYNFKLPVFGDLLTFNITGETKEIKDYEHSNTLIPD